MRGSNLGRFGAHAGLAALAFTLVACGGGDTDRDPVASTGSTSKAGSATPSADPSGPTTNLLDWQPTDETVGSADFDLSQDGKHTVFLSTPQAGKVLQFPKGMKITDLLLDDSYAVVVNQDPEEQKAGFANVFDLDSDTNFGVGPDSDVPTTNGGTWALGEGKLFHATYGPKNAYCLAEVDLASEKPSVAWCAPENAGFNDARITPTGLTVLSFTLGKDGCRTPVTIAGGEATPIEGVTECIGWDSLVTPQGGVWSETPDLNRVEEATFFATGPEGAKQELGVGDTGSLTWCGTAAYFTQQPQQDGDPARMYRWTSDGALEIVYETSGSPGFISEPRCGGSRITISAKSEGGDEQVSAPVD